MEDGFKVNTEVTEDNDNDNSDNNDTDNNDNNDNNEELDYDNDNNDNDNNDNDTNTEVIDVLDTPVVKAGIILAKTFFKRVNKVVTNNEEAIQLIKDYTIMTNKQAFDITALAKEIIVNYEKIYDEVIDS